MLKRQESNSYLPGILMFPELWGNKPDESGQVIFRKPITRLAYARMVLKAVEDVRNEYGVEEYKAKWVQHDFSSKELSELHTLIDQEKSRK